ncbi:zinc ABC transporter substrate-binding protein [Phycisphaeraceae bacterium D3-23]
MQDGGIGSMKKVFAAGLLGALVLAGLAGCTQDESAEDGRITIVATTTMIADAARVIAGDDAEVVGIMRDGEDPHIYRAKPADATAIADADVVLTNGLHLEATLGHIVENKATGVVAHLAEQDGITPITGQDGEGAPDPHCWMDVQIFKQYVEGIRDALVEADPDHAEGYRERADAYLAELDALDAWVREQFEAVPEAQRVIITSHDAFNYFGRAYGVEVHGVVGISTEQQASPRDIQRLETLVRERGVKAVFHETSVVQSLNDLVEQVADSTGIRVGGSLYSDSLGKPDTDAGTYIGMIRHNTTTMVEALR